jgi:signal transduction histidine kinase
MSAAAAGSSSDPHRGPRELGNVGLISHCGHALRTPLNAILGFAQILTLDRDHPLTPIQKERVEQIQAAGWQLLQMIDDTVELARIEVGRLNISTTPVALGPVLHKSLVRLGTQAASDRIRLEPGPGLDATAWTDPERLEQIIANLVLGALQLSRSGSVQIGVRLQGDEDATIWIRGAAPSMTSAQLQRVFLPLDHMAPDNPGSQSVQISLALTQKLVELTGSRLQVHQDPDSQFELQLQLRGPGAGGAAPRSAETA